MNPPEYFKNVYRYAESNGWRLSTKQVKEHIYLIRGDKQSEKGSETLIVLVVTGTTRQVTPKHLEYVYRVGTETNANRVVVTAEAGLRDAAKQLAGKHNIQTLPPSKVPSSAADIPDRGGQSNAQESDTPGFYDNLSRRRLVASGSVLAGGVLTSGYLITSALQSEPTFDRTRAETIQVSELRSNTDQYIGSPVHYSSATIAQVIETDAESYQLRLQLTQNGEQEDNTLLGQWSGKRYDQGVRVELWGVVSGMITYETEFGAERTVPSVEIRDMSPL